MSGFGLSNCLLALLGLSSQRIEISVMEWIDGEWATALLTEWKKKERGAQLSFTEYGVTLYVISKFVLI